MRNFASVTPHITKHPRKDPPRITPPPNHAKAPASHAQADEAVSPTRQRILDALAKLAAMGLHDPPKNQVALFSKMSPTSGTYANHLSVLRTAGLVDYPEPGKLSLTEAGYEQADTINTPASVDEMRDYCRQLVGPTKARILDAVIRVYPNSATKAEVAEEVGASASSGTYANHLSTLRTLGLIDYPSPGQVVAQPVLFLEAA